MKKYTYEVYKNDVVIMKCDTVSFAIAVKKSHEAIEEISKYIPNSEYSTVYTQIFEYEPKFVCEITPHDVHMEMQKDWEAQALKGPYFDDLQFNPCEEILGVEGKDIKRADVEQCLHKDVIENSAGGNKFLYCRDCKKEVK